MLAGVLSYLHGIVPPLLQFPQELKTIKTNDFSPEE